MSLLLTHRSSLRVMALSGLGLLALALFAACGEGGEGGVAPTATAPEASEPTRAADDSVELQETGEAPIFWRTLDGFESLRADEPYKVLFRVTSGYDEETLRIVAQRGTGGNAIEFEALRAEPEGPEDPGSYYPFNLELPQPGMWQVSVVAGVDESSFTVQAKPAAPSTRY